MICLVGVAAGAGVAWAAGDWSAAKSKAAEFKDKQQSLNKLTPEETRTIVTAVCEADEDARKDAGRDASDRVSREVNDKKSELGKVKDDANQLLDDVISDDNLKDNHDEAKSLKDDVQHRWEIIGRMTSSLRGANHPVVAFMIKQGQEAHADREEHCDAHEITLPSGLRVDCLMATGETCMVIELKPDNSRAISNGVKKAGGYAKELNDELKSPGDSAVIKRLIDIKSDFAKCKTFEAQVDCYKLCPDINDDNEFQETRADWKRDCS